MPVSFTFLLVIKRCLWDQRSLIVNLLLHNGHMNITGYHCLSIVFTLAFLLLRIGKWRDIWSVIAIVFFFFVLFLIFLLQCFFIYIVFTYSDVGKVIICAKSICSCLLPSVRHFLYMNSLCIALK